jgi:hypothetical protein
VASGLKTEEGVLYRAVSADFLLVSVCVKYQNDWRLCLSQPSSCDLW